MSQFIVVAEQSIQFISHAGLGTFALFILITSFLIFKVCNRVRKTLFHTNILYFTALILLLISGLFHFLNNLDVAEICREIAILLQGVVAIKLSVILLFQIILPLLKFQFASILEDIFAIIGYLLWAMIRLHYAGVDLSGIVTTSAVITAVIAFSMQDTLGNILGGVAIQIDRSIQIGDWVKVGDINGRVVDIRWRSTAIETRNWETVVIPNSILMKNTFSVLGRRNHQPEQWRRWVWFNVSYDTPPEKVIAVAEKAVLSAYIPNVAKFPKANCVMMDYDHGTARYAIRYWLTDLFQDDPTDSKVRVHLFAGLKRAGISPAIPKNTIHLVKETEKLAEQKQQNELEKRKTMLRQHGLFRSLNDEEINILAENLKYAPYVAGDTITQQGNIAHWLYIIFQGSVQVSVASEGGSSENLSVIKASQEGNIIGEMGLMTGEPRKATVEALDNVSCYRLDKPTFETVIRSRPEIVDDISTIIAERQQQLSETLKDMDEHRRKQFKQNHKQELLVKIRKFFKL